MSQTYSALMLPSFDLWFALLFNRFHFRLNLRTVLFLCLLQQLNTLIFQFDHRLFNFFLTQSSILFTLCWLSTDHLSESILLFHQNSLTSLNLSQQTFIDMIAVSLQSCVDHVTHFDCLLVRFMDFFGDWGYFLPVTICDVYHLFELVDLRSEKEQLLKFAILSIDSTDIVEYHIDLQRIRRVRIVLSF